MPDDMRPTPPGPNTLDTFTKGVPSLAASRMSPAIAIMLDDRLFDRARLIAKYLSEADGFVPKHLIGKTASCFAVVTRALVWKLDPYAVAQATYETPGGKVGYEGKLCHAIMENSGQIEGGIEYEDVGDWSRIQGRFKIIKSQKGHDFPVPDWKPEDEKGLGVIVRAQIKGEKKRREFKMLLVQAYPRNSTLWALDPCTQLKYTAVRRFANVAAPSLLMGVPFDRDDFPVVIEHEPEPEARPTRAQFEEKPAQAQSAPVNATTERETPPPADEDQGAVTDVDERPSYLVVDANGEAFQHADPKEAVSRMTRLIIEATSTDAVEGLWESNNLSGQLRDDGHAGLADHLHEVYVDRVKALQQANADDGAPTGTVEPDPADDQPRDDAFFAGGDYVLSPDKVKGALQWATYHEKFMGYVDQCRTSAELRKLMADNKSWLDRHNIVDLNASNQIKQHVAQCLTQLEQAGA